MSTEWLMVPNKVIILLLYWINTFRDKSLSANFKDVEMCFFYIDTYECMLIYKYYREATWVCGGMYAYVQKYYDFGFPLLRCGPKTKSLW